MDVLGAAFGLRFPHSGSWEPLVLIHSSGRSCIPRCSVCNHREGLCWCPSGVLCGDSVMGSPRYRCLVDMWSNVIPNGSNCVEMLRSLCPVNPSMYYVGVTKVLSWDGAWFW